IERELRQMQMAGIGGVEVQPVYPLSLDDPSARIRNLPYLSDDFIHALTFASEKARQLGLRFDLTLGSGWPYGGPSVPVREAAGRPRVQRVKPSGTTRLKVPNLGAGEKLLAVFLVSAPSASGLQRTRETTDIADGAVHLPDDFQNPLEVQFFISSRTGMQVKRAALGAEGFVL